MLDRIFIIPEIDADVRRVIRLIEELRERLRHQVAQPRRWVGSLRRNTFARAMQGSNSIEGYNASLDDVLAAVDGEPLQEAEAETVLAVAGYRDAMTYVLQVASDGQARIDAGLLKSLHFMMIKHDLARHPGRWRPGPVYVRDEARGQIVYEGPPAADVPELIASMLDQLAPTPDGDVLVTAAMAHLNLVMIHPFSDGNGRMARCLQTLILAREGILAAPFSSIEEYLGRNTPAYYAVLAEVGGGAWHPENDAAPWLRFCLTAHYRQARTLLRRVHESHELWNACAALVQAAGVAERAIGPLWDAAVGLRLRNATYRANVEVTAGESISELTASRDLRSLVDAGLLTAVGERRGRQYLGSDRTRAVWDEIWRRRPPREEDDPFGAAPGQQELGGRATT